MRTPETGPESMYKGGATGFMGGLLAELYYGIQKGGVDFTEAEIAAMDGTSGAEGTGGLGSNVMSRQYSGGGAVPTDVGGGIGGTVA